MTDNIRHPSLSRKAGRGFLRALKGLFGGRTLKRATESWDVLREEYAAGKEEAQDGESAPRRIPHRELPPTSDEPPAPRRAP